MTISETQTELRAVTDKLQGRREAIALLESKGYNEQAALLEREALRECKGLLQRICNLTDSPSLLHR